MKGKIQTFGFCESFIDNLIDTVDENFIQKGVDLSRVAIVFGGKRPALFIKRALAKKFKKSFFPPRHFTIDGFMAYTACKDKEFAQAVDMNNRYLLYKLAKEHTPEILKGRESFAQFLPWTQEILSFIDQLDLEHIEDSALLNIQANAEIGYDVPEDINRLLTHIVKLRNAYHKEMIKTNTFSRGFQYLRAAQVIKGVDFDEFDQILFCNFFYFNKSEEIVIEHLTSQEKASCIFQGDQRKWPVFERISSLFSTTIYEGQQPQTPNLHLNVYKGFDAHSQVGIAREVLKRCKNLNNTVIVLPNPDNLIPLLSEMTKIVKDFNISMGYPLRRSSLYTLFEFVFKAQLSKKATGYYTKDYLKVLRHPFVKNLRIQKDPALTRILIHKIEEVLIGKEQTSLSGSLFLQLEDVETDDELKLAALEMLNRLGIKTDRKQLSNTLETLHKALFKDWEEVNHFEGFARILGEFLDLFVQKSFLKNYPLNINIATKMYDIRDELFHASFKNENFLKEDIFKIFESKIQREMVAFLGSPLKGLQVLGLFETRSLNFENVLVLDVNESVLPKLNIYEPLVPREVMISLNLDRLEQEEEIQRYQFMRLISSAKNVHLIYQESRDKERSRFIEELIWSEEKKANDLDVVPITKGSFEVSAQPQEVRIQKTPEIMEFLKNFTYSASSINTYLREPMEFYSNYVLGLKEKEDLLDEPEARHVGTFVHELLEESFLPYLNKKPRFSSHFKTKFFDAFDEKFDQTFGKGKKSDSFLLKSVIRERLNRFLDNEALSEERAVEKILYLENQFEETIDLSCGQIKFKYIVDRIDQLKDGSIMILDYKTGGIDQMPRSFKHMKSLELSRETIKENVRSFQIPLYFHYFDKKFEDRPINAALYNLRTLKVHKFLENGTIQERKEINELFMQPLDYVLSEILNPHEDFVYSASRF